MTITPVILSGGSGTRLWPLSRRLYPKQLLALVTEATLLQETMARVGGGGFGRPLVICNAEHRFIVAEQLRDVGVDATIVLEPVGRNTAPAAAVAALIAAGGGADAQILLLPSDHVIAQPEAFAAAVVAAAQAAAQSPGHLVTFGIRPDRPETGYGYIRQGAPIDGAPGAFAVERFVEKPDRETAERFVADGGYAWNSGMFLLPAALFLAELARLQPDLLAACRGAVEKGADDLDFFRLDEASFAASPGISIDVGVMEQTVRAAVVPADLGWNDVGSFSALWAASARDAGGNAAIGDVLAVDASGNYLRAAEGQVLACVGISDMVVVATPDAVLVSPIGRSQDVKMLVERMEREDRHEHLHHLRVVRPWGWYQQVDAGAGFQVKRICVKAGARLSLQYHNKRAEHWVVVSGAAEVTRGDHVATLTANQSTYIPVGMAHRLANRGSEPLHLIEVQSGDYLGEDDIVRLEDDFARSSDD